MSRYNIVLWYRHIYWKDVSLIVHQFPRSAILVVNCLLRSRVYFALTSTANFVDSGGIKICQHPQEVIFSFESSKNKKQTQNIVSIFLCDFNWYWLILFLHLISHAYHFHISQEAFRSLEPVVGKMVHSVSFSTTGGQAWPRAGVWWELCWYIWNVSEMYLHIDLLDFVG